MQTKDITDREVCKAYAIRALGMRFADAILQEMTGAHWRACYRAMLRADRHGLIEYGVSLRSGWLTDKGKALLELDPKALKHHAP